MNNRQVQTSSNWLGAIRSELSPSRQVVAQVVIGFDGKSRRCHDIAAELDAIASSLDRKLAAAIAPVAIEAGAISTITPDVSRPEAWQDLAEMMLVFVPKGPSPGHRPGLTLVLPCDLLRENESRAAMLQQFAELADKHSSIVCVFVEGDACDQLQQGWDEAAWNGWLGEVKELLPSTVVRFYLVGRTTNDGRLLMVADQTTVAAHAIFADVVLPDRNAPRYLAQSMRRPEASIGVLGMSGQLVSADAASQCLTPRVCRELVAEVQSCQPVAIDLPDDLPTDPFQLLVQAFQHQMPFNATAALERAESQERSDYEVPSLVGYDYRFTVNIGKAAKAITLDSIPPSIWRARLTELGALISRERATAVAAHACEYLNQLRTRDERRIQSILRQSFATRLCDGPVRVVGDCLLDRIDKHRNTLIVTGTQEDIEESLDFMDVQIQKLGCWRNGLFATLLALLLAIAVIWACNAWATGTIRGWGTILPAAAVAMIGLVAAGRWCWARHVAIKSRDNVLEQIQRRAQHTLCELLHQELEKTASQLFDSTKSSVTALCEAARVITKSTEQATNSPESQQPLIDRPRPHSEEMESIYRFVTQQQTEYTSLVDKFQERCSDLANEVIQGSVASNHALTSLHEFLMNELLLLLSHRMDIWRLYCQDNTASSFDDATFFNRVQVWSVPVFCGTGNVLTRREGGGYSTTTSWICPDALASRVVGHVGTTLLPMGDRVLALHRMTLSSNGTATLSMCDERNPRKVEVAHATDE